MSTKQQPNVMVTHRGDLEEMMRAALQKIGGSKENDLCKFLPSTKDGYIHHFTMKKMKSEQPKELLSLIEKYIVKSSNPGKIAPRPRAARGSRKKRDVITLTRADVERLLNIARQVGDKEMVAKLSPKRSLASLRRELTRSIRQGRVDHELWNAYVDTCTPASASFVQGNK